VATRTARTTWTGTLQEGLGRVELLSSGAGTFEVSFPRRAADDAEGVTSPEELLAAAQGACYSMTLSNVLGMAGATSMALDISVDARWAPDPAGGFHVADVTIHVGGSVGGVDESEFLKLAQDAEAGCAVSKALSGTNIILDVALEVV
jgi:lipoyl-dependent peroxiredoxin